MAVDPIQVVVANGIVVATHDFSTDLYDQYDHATYDWFDFADVINTESSVSIPTVAIVQSPARLVINDGVEDPADADSATAALELVAFNQPTIVANQAIPDPRLAMSLANCKLAVISQLARIRDHEILATYPLQKQADIERLASPWDSTARTNMHTFIDGKRSTYDTKVAAVNALGSNANVIAYDVWA